MHRLAVPLMFAVACGNGPNVDGVTAASPPGGEPTGRVVILQYEAYDAVLTDVCEENFERLACIELDATVESTTDRSLPSRAVVLLDGGSDVPPLLIDDTVMFGEAVEGGYRWTFSGFDTNTRTLTDPSSWTSTYVESQFNDLTLEMTETADGVWDWTVTQSFGLTQDAEFTDTLNGKQQKVLQLAVPDPFFWPLPQLTFDEDVPYYQAYYLDIFGIGVDDCTGATCTFSLSSTLDVTASGTGRLATELTLTDDFDPFSWGRDPGADGPTFAIAD